MFDLPLHPIAVHFPIVLGFLLPFAGLLLWWAIKKEHLPAKAWILVIALAFVYSVSAVVTAQLGENDEEKVEKVVSEKLIDEHEEAAEWVPWTAGTLFLISLAGLVRKNPNRIRLAIALLSLAAVVPVVNAGHTGGKLVYQYGAANAHLLPKYKALVQSGKFYLVHKDDEKHENEED